MSHHLSNSLSASAASALHVVGGHVRAFAPSPRVVLSVATLASAGVLGLAAFGVTSSHTTVMLEVNGVTRPVTAWGNTVGDALEVANVSVGSGDLVQPGLAETVHEGDTIVVRSSRAYTVTVDGETRHPVDHGHLSRRHPCRRRAPGFHGGPCRRPLCVARRAHSAGLPPP